MLGYFCPLFILKWVRCPYSVRIKVSQMSVFISTPNILLAEVRVLVRSNKVVATIKVDAAINLVAAIKAVGTKAEGLHVLQLAQ